MSECVRFSLESELDWSDRLTTVCDCFQFLFRIADRRAIESASEARLAHAAVNRRVRFSANRSTHAAFTTWAKPAHVVDGA